MAPILYDGKARAAEIRKQVSNKISDLKKRTGITPKLAIIKVSDVAGVDMYTKMKQKAAEEVGAEVEIYDMSNAKHRYVDIMKMIRYLSSNDEYHGVMVQLPLPKKMKGKERFMFEVFNSVKDVDGMGEQSQYMKPVTMAVMDAFKDYKKNLRPRKPKVLVVGSKGFVGSDILKVMEGAKVNVKGVDRSANQTFSIQNLVRATKEVNLIVTATGEHKLLYDGNVMSDKVGIIDVGAPKPEVDYPYLEKKLTYLTPVPGGIGPVTIAYLLENLYKATYNLARKKKSHT